MAKHPVDHRAAPESGRTRHFPAIERQQGEEGSHPATRALFRRPPEEAAADRRLKEYTRIERGKRS